MPDSAADYMADVEFQHAPLGWLRRFGKDCRCRQTWKDVTGERNSSLAVILPIHNERRHLVDVLKSLELVLLPERTTIIGVTNACTDDTPDRLMVHLSSLGTTRKRVVDVDFPGLRQWDPKISPHYYSLEQQGKDFLWFDTPTRGKANAVNVGLVVANELGQGIAISADANNYPEPEALALLFRALTTRENKVALLSGVSMFERLHGNPLLSRLRSPCNTANNTDSAALVCGWLMAMRVPEVLGIGGVPKMTIEDCALGFALIANGYQIGRVLEARSWGFQSGAMKDVVSEATRYHRGHMQIDDDPVLAPIQRQLRPDCGDFSKRIHYYLHCQKERGVALPAALAKCLFWESARIKGWLDYQHDKSSYTWAPVGTKL